MRKQLCSTDEIEAEKKYKDPFYFVPSHTLVLYTNHLPKVGANDDGIWRRLIVIPFSAKITGKSDIKNYADYLVDEAGPAIMKWIVEGAEKAIGTHFHTDLPQAVRDAIYHYRDSNDWLGQFLEEHCDLDPSYEEKSSELYQAYRMACVQSGEFMVVFETLYHEGKEVASHADINDRGQTVEFDGPEIKTKATVDGEKRLTPWKPLP